MPVSFASTGGSLPQTAVSLTCLGSRHTCAWSLVSRSQPDSGISRRPHAGSPVFPSNPLSLCPVLRSRWNLHASPISASRYCPSVTSVHGTSTMRSFRDSIARPHDLLSTLRAGIATDYARLASGGWLVLAVSPSQATGFVQPISLLVSEHLLRLRTFHGARWVTPRPIRGMFIPQ